MAGLAVAAELARPGASVFVLEKNPAFGMGISSRNSEVIHAGLYYPAETLKARLCLEGNRLLYERAARTGIPCRKTGKLIVANQPGEAGRTESACWTGDAPMAWSFCK